MKITLGLAQISPKLGDVPANLSKHLARIDEAAAQGVELLLFPELSTGYYLQDMVYEWASLRPRPNLRPAVGGDRRHALDLTVGFVEEDARPFLHFAGVPQRRGGRRAPQSLPADLWHVRRGRYFAWGDRCAPQPLRADGR